jgi:methionyl-tRNA formyltransferase
LPLNTVFFGSPEDAVPGLAAVIDAGHAVAAVYTRPDKEAGRKRQSTPTPVRVAAEARGLRVETPAGLRSAEVQETLRKLNADVFVVAAYGRILPPEVLAMPRLGAVNIHPSLLPRYRGPSPVATAIRNGDAATGVSVMLLDEGMDSGPLLAQSPPILLDGTERADELTARLFRIGAEMLPGVLDALEAGTLTPEPQDDSLVNVTRLIEKEDGNIDWSQRAVEIERMTRAYDPWPGAFSSLAGKNLKILSAVVASEGKSAPAGTVSIREKRIFVATVDGELELQQVQPGGKRPISARDFLNGTPGLDGAVLGG